MQSVNPSLMQGSWSSDPIQNPQHPSFLNFVKSISKSNKAANWTAPEPWTWNNKMMIKQCHFKTCMSLFIMNDACRNLLKEEKRHLSKIAPSAILDFDKIENVPWAWENSKIYYQIHQPQPGPISRISFRSLHDKKQKSHDIDHLVLRPWNLNKKASA